ncbi:MAG: hypothetical protein HQM11_05690 [SAR324 cluster bacterium]|nr:hypothetical protein [SAR324 cluster bacterium]
MRKPFVSKILTVLIITGMVHPVIGAGLKEFTGGVSNNTMTINPASVSAVDQVHTQYEVISFNTDNLQKTTPLAETVYNTGQFNHAEGSVIIPGTGGSIGFEQTVTLEQYTYQSKQSGSVYDYFNNGEVVYSSQSQSDLDFNTDISTFTTSAVLGYPFLDKMYVGVKLNRRLVDMKYQLKYSNTSIQWNNYASEENIGGTREYSITADYTFDEYGVLFPYLFSTFGMGLFYRPIVEIKADLNQIDTFHQYNESGGLNFSKPENDTLEIKEPSLTILGFAYTFDLGNWGVVQLMRDFGVFSDTENSFQGIRKGDGMDGGLIRILMPPLVDLYYGTQTKDVGEYKVTKITSNLTFPVWDLGVVSLGLQTVTVLGADATVLSEVTYPTISMDLKFGSPRKRNWSPEPKSEKIPFFRQL